MQLPPSSSLTGIVKHYLVLESERYLDADYRLFSDGNPGLIFHYHTPLIQFTPGSAVGNSQPNSFLYGQITQYKDLRSNGKLGMVAVVLQPSGIYSLLGISANELNNRIIRLSEIFGREALELEEHVLGAANIPAILEQVENFLIKKTIHKQHPHPVFEESLTLIYQSKGRITIQELLKQLPITERQLERSYHERIGITPKKFTDIIRFQHFLKLLQNDHGENNISDAVYDAGFYDHSHLTNYFKRYTGITPTQYQLNPHLLAINFMKMR